MPRFFKVFLAWLVLTPAQAASLPEPLARAQLTTYAALELLGPAYRWKTEACASGLGQIRR